ncbi:hypothetical protein Esti_002594 [Eimeria stiedai]
MRLFLSLLLALAAFCSKAVELGAGDTKSPTYVQCTGADALLLTFYKRFERICVRSPATATVKYMLFALASLAGETRPVQVRHRGFWRKVLRRQNIGPETPLKTLAMKHLEVSVMDGGAREPLDTRFVYLLPRLDLNNVPLLSLEAVSINYSKTSLYDVSAAHASSRLYIPELSSYPFRAFLEASPPLLSKLFPNRTYSPVELRRGELRLVKYIPSKVYSFPMKKSTYFCGAKIPYRISDLGMKQLADAFASEEAGERSKLNMIAARRPRSPDEEQDPTIVLVQYFERPDGFVTMKETAIHVESVEAACLHSCVHLCGVCTRTGRGFFRNFFTDNSRLVSRLSGALARLRISRCFLWSFTEWTNADLEEAFSAKPAFPESARTFKSIQEYFTRPLNIEVWRPIDAQALVVSPADSVIQNAFFIRPNEDGEILDAHIPQVKGTTFNLSDFLFGRGTNRNLKLQSPENRLHVQIFYLSPSNYHRFHSSADWQATRHVYIPGCIPSVKRNLLLSRNILDAFERTSVQGHWRPGNTHGPRLFFSMTFVAAMAVGGIQLHYREELDSNKFTFTPFCASLRKSTVYEYTQPVPLCMGQEMGTFKFGSTVVLVFEAPEDFTASTPVCEHVDVNSTTGRIPGSPRRTLPRCDFTYGNYSSVVQYLTHLQSLKLQDAAEGLSAGPAGEVPIAPHIQAPLETGDAGVLSMLQQESGEVTDGDVADGDPDVEVHQQVPQDEEGPGAEPQPFGNEEPEESPQQLKGSPPELLPQQLDDLEQETLPEQLEERGSELPRGTEEGEPPLWWFEGQQRSHHRSIVRHVTGEEKPISSLPDVGAKIEMVESGLVRRYALARYLAAFWKETSAGSSGGSVLLQLGQLRSGETDSSAGKPPTCYFEESTRTVLLRFSGKKSTLLLMVPAAKHLGFFLRYPNFACASTRGWGKKTRGVRASWSVGDGVLNVKFSLSVTQRVGEDRAAVGELAFSFAAAARPTPIFTHPKALEMSEEQQQMDMYLGVNIRVRHFHLTGPQDISEANQQVFTVSSGTDAFVIPETSSARYELTCPDSPFYRVASAIRRGIRRLPFFRRGQEEPESAQ